MVSGGNLNSRKKNVKASRTKAKVAKKHIHKGIPAGKSRPKKTGLKKPLKSHSSGKLKTPKINAKVKGLTPAKLRAKALLEAKEKEEKELRRLRIEREKLEMERVNHVLSDSYARQLLIELAGENALEIIRNFNGNLSDEDLSKTLKLKISDVRATLNRLHSEGLVSYLREKDSDTGWYSYSWQLNRIKIEEWVSGKVSSRYKVFEESAGDHYYCPPCGAQNVLLHLGDAHGSSFKCPKCNSTLEYFDRERAEEIMNSKSRSR